MRVGEHAIRPASLLLPALACVALATACGAITKAGGPEREHTAVLRIANRESADADLAEYVAAVNRLSRGAIRLEVESGWRQNDVDYASGTISDVRAGKIAFGKVPVSAYDRLGVHDFQALTAPFLVDSLTLEEKVLASPIADEMLEAVGRLGVDGLALLPGPLQRPFSLDRRLRGPKSYLDAVIATTSAPTARRTFEALGAFPRPYLPGELGPGFDGAELDLSTVENSDYVTGRSSVSANVVFWPRPFTVVANREVLARLTSRQRGALEAAARAALRPAIQRLGDADRAESTNLCGRKQLALIPATPAERDALNDAVQPVFTWLRRNPRTRSLIAEIRGMKSRAPREAPLRCSMPGAATKPTTLLDGRWEMAVSRARVLNETHDSVGADVDSGRYRMTLRRGHISISHLGPGPRWTATGTFRLPRSDEVLFHTSTEDDLYRWNLYRGALTLARLPGSASAPNPTFAPWYRVGG